MFIFLKRLWKYLAIFIEIIFQKFRCIGIGDISTIGESIEGKTVIITGPTSGIGESTSIELAKRKANVILACRNTNKGEKLKEEIISKTSNSNIIVEKLDVSDTTSIRNFVEKWQKSQKPIHVFIANAGIFDIGGSRKETNEGFEQHLMTNYLSNYILILGLMSNFKKAVEMSGEARIIAVSSKLHDLMDFNKKDPFLQLKNAYASDIAYSQSKLAIIAFIIELRRRLSQNSGIIACSLHPGEIVTDIARNINSIILWIHKNINKHILFSTSEGSRCTIYCATGKDIKIQAAKCYGYFDSNCQPILPYKMTRAPEFGKWLWNWSFEITKIPSLWSNLN